MKERVFSVDEFLEFVAGIFRVPAASLSGETSYGSIPQWDSLMQLRLIGEIEDQYEIEIPIDDVANLRTLADLYRTVSG
jgi:acyl carrier protein